MRESERKRMSGSTVGGLTGPPPSPATPLYYTPQKQPRSQLAPSPLSPSLSLAYTIQFYTSDNAFKLLTISLKHFTYSLLAFTI